MAEKKVPIRVTTRGEVRPPLVGQQDSVRKPLNVASQNKTGRGNPHKR